MPKVWPPSLRALASWPVVAVLLLTLPDALQAAERAYVNSPHSFAEARQSVSSITDGDSSPIAPVKLRVRARGLGTVDFKFTTKKSNRWVASFSNGNYGRLDRIQPLLLQGSLTSRRLAALKGKRTRRVAAALIENTLTVSFAAAKGGTRRRLYTIRMRVDGALVVQVRTASIPEAAIADVACGSIDTAAALESEATDDEPVEPATATYRQVTVSTEADAEWYAKYGEGSNAQIAAIINAADVLYKNQLGVTFKLVKQHTYTGPSVLNSTVPSTLLDQFTNNPENAGNLSFDPRTFLADVDLKHLFTGKDLDGSIVGIAYIGVVCSSPDIATGLTQDFGSAGTWGIFAHEVGHNFGAAHDTSSPGTVMYPSISVPPSEKFSGTSSTQIQDQLSRFGPVCLESVQGTVPNATPVPQPTSAPTPFLPPDPTAGPLPPPSITPGGLDPADADLRLSKRLVRYQGHEVYRLSGSLRRRSGQPYVDAAITLVSQGTLIARRTTRGNGRFAFYVDVQVPASKRLTAWVLAGDGAIISNGVELRRTKPAPRNASRR